MRIEKKRKIIIGNHEWRWIEINFSFFMLQFIDDIVYSFRYLFIFPFVVSTIHINTSMIFFDRNLFAIYVRIIGETFSYTQSTPVDTDVER